MKPSGEGWSLVEGRCSIRGELGVASPVLPIRSVEASRIVVGRLVSLPGVFSRTALNPQRLTDRRAGREVSKITLSGPVRRRGPGLPNGVLMRGCLRPIIQIERGAGCLPVRVVSKGAYSGATR